LAKFNIKPNLPSFGGYCWIAKSGLIAVLVVNVVVVVGCFAYLQSEINSLKPQYNPIPTSTTNLYTPSPTNTLTTEATPNTSHAKVTYVWYLKPEIKGNTTWLKESANLTGAIYDPAKNWSSNYIEYISSIWEIPTFVRDAYLTGPVGAAFILQLPVTVSYDPSTGYSEATYKYQSDTIYCLEGMLPNFAVNGNWTKEYV
jgi:hypothetical protein